MSDRPIPDRILDAALDLAARDGAAAATPAAIAREAGLSLVELHDCFVSRTALLTALLARVDRTMLAGGPADPEDSLRDRLFEIIMRRLDVLQAHRAGYRAMLGARDPALLALLPAGLRSLQWIGNAAGLPLAGLRGALRLQALGVVYAATLRTWLADDSPDLGKTMAALDGALQRCGRLVSDAAPNVAVHKTD